MKKKPLHDPIRKVASSGVLIHANFVSEGNKAKGQEHAEDYMFLMLNFTAGFNIFYSTCCHRTSRVQYNAFVCGRLCVHLFLAACRLRDVGSTKESAV